MISWINEAVVYHIYTLGFCGAEPTNLPTIETQNRIKKVKEWIPYLKKLGINTILFAPLFESESHGYNTVDFKKVDRRLGTNKDFKEVCDALHEAGIRILLDGVFNHVGRGFFAFKDIQEKRERSHYIDWFVNIRFNGNSPLGDPFYYEGWEGHYELVKLNLTNGAVKNYLLDAVKSWIEEYQIDGLRLDVAYSLDKNFVRDLRSFVDSQKKDFWLMGEIIHGNYKTLIQSDMLDSATNYECYKGIYSSHNDKNYFEINYSLNRLFSRGGLYEGDMLYNFVDNHDVTRVATVVKDKNYLKNIYTILFTMPGIPSIYYGSEWAIEGGKRYGDAELRPCLDLEDMLKRDQSLREHIHKLILIRKTYVPLQKGHYEQIVVKNEQVIFARNFENDRMYVALNLSAGGFNLDFGVPSGSAWVNVLTNDVYYEQNGRIYLSLEPFESKIFVEKEKVKSLAELEYVPKEEHTSEAKEIPVAVPEEPEELEVIPEEPKEPKEPEIISEEPKEPEIIPEEPKELEIIPEKPLEIIPEKAQESESVQEKPLAVYIKVTIQRKPTLKIGIEIEENQLIEPHVTIEEK